jgi:glutathione peroxidase
MAAKQMLPEGKTKAEWICFYDTWFLPATHTTESIESYHVRGAFVSAVLSFLRCFSDSSTFVSSAAFWRYKEGNLNQVNVPEHLPVDKSSASALNISGNRKYIILMNRKTEMGDFYSLSAISMAKKDISFEEYKDKVVVVVNTASKCGFTPQYAGLEKLYKKYKDKGLVILGFPCNQFANQEPGDEKTIQETCLINYGVSFPMFSKIKVNGPGTHPVFVWLKKRFGGFGSRRIKWNFTKFLINRDGKPVKRYAPIKTPESMEDAIRGLLGV